VVTQPSNKNIKTCTWGGKPIHEPRNFRARAAFSTIEDEAGDNTLITSNDPRGGRVEIQLAFGNFEDGENMLSSGLGGTAALVWGGEAELILTTQDLGTNTERGLKYASARLVEVQMEGIHQSPAGHIAIFICKSADGGTSPITKYVVP
jgi:hypothetical protein